MSRHLLPELHDSAHADSRQPEATVPDLHEAVVSEPEFGYMCQREARHGKP